MNDDDDDDDDDIIYVCVWNCVNIIEYMSVIISEYDSQNASDDSICLYKSLRTTVPRTWFPVR